MGRPATPEDIDDICRSLPEVELSSSRVDRPTYQVRSGALTEAWASKAPQRLVARHLERQHLDRG